ncbi:hypothetical protein [Motilimonas pumila]|uniref:Uncharacterized protein n=1 Tax=Motilimonas pumila TaxID=2303987 RepID=A0A418Y915_9GAMM|nr:hypothetical protein [Motilimonas pumila]RJG35956.1 hypothetical protein D1Z90_20645 [Motilimonas pumila]
MKKWLIEVEEALSEALNAISDGGIPSGNMYMLASIFYSKRQNMNNTALINEMSDATDQMVKEDWSYDERSKYQYKFHFVSAYLFCFVVAGKITEMKYDQIMEFVNGQMDLFTEGYSE